MCKTELAQHKPSIFSNGKEEILSKHFSGVSYTDRLWSYLETICIIHTLRELNSRVRIGGVVGAHNSGKSFLLNKAFGFDTSPGLSQEYRTVEPKPFSLSDKEIKVAMVDFPGSDEIVINKNQIRFMMEACNGWVIMTTYEHGFSNFIADLLAIGKRRRIPCLLVFNKSDVVWKDCKKKKKKRESSPIEKKRD